MNNEQKKQRYENILSLFKKPSSIKDVVTDIQQHRLFCTECKMLLKSELMTRERGIDASGRKTWLYKAVTLKLTPLQASIVIKHKTDYSREKSMGSYKLTDTPIDTPVIMQKMLDVLQTEMKASEALKIIKEVGRDRFYKCIRSLKAKGYISINIDANKRRGAMYKTINPIYQPDRAIPEKEKPVKGYINGVCKVSINDYHPARVVRKSARNYVSGSTLAWI